MKRIKVLHIIKTLRVGGAQANLLNLVQVFDAARFEMFVAYSAGGELEEKFIRAGVGLFKYADRDYKLKSFATFGIITRLAKFMRDNNIDIVHTHNLNGHVWGGLAAKLTGAKLLEHVHDFRYLEPAEYVRRRGRRDQLWVMRYLRNFSNMVVVLTKQNTEFLSKHRIYPDSKVQLQHNGIQLPGAGAVPSGIGLRGKFGIPSDAVVALTPIRFVPEKNVDLILRIAPKVIAECPQMVFVLAGDGPLLEASRQEAKERGLEGHIRFVGFQQDVRGLLAMSDIFLAPSFLENHSIALLEAMSMARPVVISRNVGCHNEFIIDGENGILLDPFKDDGWADSLIRLADSPSLRLKLGQAALKTCRDTFDINTVGRKFEETYAQLVGYSLAQS